MNPSSPICRTCLGIISEGQVGYNIDDENGLIKNVQNIREMIMCCIPEMDTYISVNPSICDGCLHILVNIYNYKLRCIRVESAIRSYIVANNVMEGSCVDLSNVVRQQIVDALKQKNWPPDVIQEYIVKVDSCLNVFKKKPTVPPEIFNIMSQNFNDCNSLNVSNANELIQNLPENNPQLNCLLDDSLEASSNEQAIPTTKYLTVNRNLMPERQKSFFTSSLNRMTPNLTKHGPPNFPIARQLSATESFQSAFLSTLNMINANDMGREEAVIVKPQKATNNSTAQHLTAGKDTCRNTFRMPHKAKAQKSKTVEEENSIIVVDDQEPETAKNNGEEVLIMNFGENESVAANENGSSLGLDSSLKPQGTLKPSVSTELRQIRVFKKVAVKPNTGTLKRKLTPEDVIEEIRSKRRKLTVKVNPNLPYLHKHKKLIVRLRNERFFKCMFCSFVTIQPKGLKNHYRRFHKVCKLCNYKTDKKTELDQHINTRHREDFKKVVKQSESDKVDFGCYLCKFIGFSVFDLRDHRIGTHMKCDINGMYKCPFTSCTKEDAIAVNLARHIDVKHDNVRKRECLLCNYTASSSNKLKNHVQSHKLMTKMICPLCGWSCKSAFSLDRHREKKHAEADTENATGMAYAPTPDDLQRLITDENGRITLDSFPNSIATNSRQNASASVNESADFDQPSLSEMLCAQMLYENPEQEDDCTVVSQTNESKPKNTHDKQSCKEIAPDDPEDCMIIESRQEIMTVDLSDEDVSENPSKRPNIDDSGNNGTSDVIEIMDEDYMAEASIPKRSKRPGRSSKVSVSPNTSLQGTTSNGEKETGSRPSVFEILEQQPADTSNVICNNNELSVERPPNEKQETGSSESKSDSLESNNNLLEQAKKPNMEVPTTKTLEKLLDEHFSMNYNTAIVTKPHNNSELCSESVLIESSDDDSNECSVITEAANINSDKETAHSVESDSDKERNLKSNPNNTSSKVDNRLVSDDNIILSDSEPENAEVIQKLLEVELIPDIIIGNIENTDGNNSVTVSVDKEKTVLEDENLDSQKQLGLGEESQNEGSNTQEAVRDSINEDPLKIDTECDSSDSELNSGMAKNAQIIIPHDNLSNITGNDKQGVIAVNSDLSSNHESADSPSSLTQEMSDSDSNGGSGKEDIEIPKTSDRAANPKHLPHNERTAVDTDTSRVDPDDDIRKRDSESPKTRNKDENETSESGECIKPKLDDLQILKLTDEITSDAACSAFSSCTKTMSKSAESHLEPGNAECCSQNVSKRSQNQNSNEPNNDNILSEANETDHLLKHIAPGTEDSPKSKENVHSISCVELNLTSSQNNIHSIGSSDIQK